MVKKPTTREVTKLVTELRKAIDATSDRGLAPAEQRLQAYNSWLQNVVSPARESYVVLHVLEFWFDHHYDDMLIEQRKAEQPAAAEIVTSG